MGMTLTPSEVQSCYDQFGKKQDSQRFYPFTACLRHLDRDLLFARRFGGWRCVSCVRRTV